MSKGPPSSISTKLLADGLARFDIISDEAAEAKRILPTPTVWGRASGLPIHDRLPGLSEGYRLEYSEEKNTGLVFIDGQTGTYRGPGSMEIGALADDPGLLIIQSGTITWQYGQIDVDGLAVNLRSVVDGGVQDGSYLVGYYLGYETLGATTGVYAVEDFSLASSETVYAASSTGPEAPVTAMFSDVDRRAWRPNLYGSAGPYRSGPAVSMDFTVGVRAESFRIEAERTGQELAKCALYRSDDGAIWHLEDSRSATDGGWTVQAQSRDPHRFWRLFFWDGYVNAASTAYSGEAAFPVIPPVGKIPVAEPFLEGKFDTLEDRARVILGEIEVSGQKIVKVTDLRRTTSTKYEPVAKWLTSFQDESLRGLFSSIEAYAADYMSPESGGERFYGELSGRSGLTLGSSADEPVLRLPDLVELKPGTETVADLGLMTGPPEQSLGIDPNPTQLYAENVSLYESSSSVTPTSVILLGEPESASDLVTKSYTDTTFVLDLDNGVY